MKKLKNKDIKDLSAADDNSLAEDSRVKVHNFNYNVYPYTIEYEIETKQNNTFIFPSWTPQQGENFSVEQSDYSIIFPENYKLRFKQFNYKDAPQKTTEKGNIKMKWNVSQVPAIKLPFAVTSWAELATVVYFAPSDFEIGKYKGNMNTWAGFGDFQNSLNAGRDVLPATIAQKVTEITAGIGDTKEKIKVL